ncbi:hypothetical protein ACETRX_35720 [Labrys portucalensis]|uniref:ABM domain-containing protein n=1 Tax=Labrys neptuniae TaxID=376174 RepID=A0ABV6ZS00_9HYPH
MMLKKTLAIATGLLLTMVAGQSAAQAQEPKPVIEVVTLKLKPTVTPAQFATVDHQIETDVVSKRSGFLSRESAPGSDKNWVVIVHWRSLADAEASMKSFSDAPGAAKFMSLIVPGSMVMTRYGG